RDPLVTGVQTCALPIYSFESATLRPRGFAMGLVHGHPAPEEILGKRFQHTAREVADRVTRRGVSCRERRIGPDDDERRGRQRLRSEERRVGKEWRAWGR